MIIDSTDSRLLKALQADGRMTNAKLAETVGLSETPCWRRTRDLEAAGVITGYQAALDRGALGLGVLAHVAIRVQRHEADATEAFEAAVSEIPEILTCYNTTGDVDYLLTVVARDLDSYGRFTQDVLRRLPGIAAMTSSLTLRTIKESRALPLPGFP